MAWFGNSNQQKQQPANNGNANQQMPNNNQQQQQQPNNQQQPNSNQQQPNQNTSSNEPQNPLDVYGKMFDNAPEGDKAPSFTIDPKVMDQVTGSQDFMRGIDPALVQKATSGDANAMMELMQHTSRAAYRAAIEHGGVLTDKFVGSYSQYQGKKLPGQLKSQLTEQSLAANTPNFKHPVVKKQLTEIAGRLSAQHPDASPQEIADMSRNYLKDLMSAMNPEDPNAATQTKGETNWDTFFDEDNSNG